MTLNTNLSHAKRAIDYVRTKMTIGASNKPLDFITSFGGSLLCVIATRNTDIALTVGVIPKWIRAEAAKAETVGCGNCGEQAALAFVKLYDTYGARPIDYMARNNANHAFVVIGRKNGSKADDYTTWGDSAVICDPWHNKVYPASEVLIKMYGGGAFRPSSLFRIS